MLATINARHASYVLVLGCHGFDKGPSQLHTRANSQGCDLGMNVCIFPLSVHLAHDADAMSFRQNRDGQDRRN